MACLNYAVIDQLVHPVSLLCGEGDFVALDAALNRLLETYGRPAQVVELRFSGGMEVRDNAALLQVTERTVLRDWQLAKLWLHREPGKNLGGP